MKKRYHIFLLKSKKYCELDFLARSRICFWQEFW